MEKQAFKRKPVESSNIVSIGHSFPRRMLEVEFKNGSVYRYKGVNNKIYRAILSSDSKGKALHNLVKGKYPYKKIVGKSENNIKEANIVNYEEMVKEAYEEIMGFNKEAATIAEVYKTIKNKNSIPRPKGLKAKWNERENFIGTTRTIIRPSDSGGEFGYDVSTWGSGRKNDRLDAESAYRDLVRLHYSDDDERAKYDERMQPTIDRYLKTSPVRFITKSRRGKNVVKLLSDKERDVLKNFADRRAKEHTDDASSAHRLTATNTYYY